MNRGKQLAIQRLKNADQEIIERAIDESDQEAVDFALTGNFVAYMEYLTADQDLSANQRLFLGEFAKDALVSYAAMRSGIAASNYYRWIKQDAFRLALEEAKKVANERLEKLALNLASGVYKRPIVSMGKLVAYEPIIDSRMLTTLLRARMPDKYSQKVDVTSGGHSLVKLVDKDAWNSV